MRKSLCMGRPSKDRSPTDSWEFCSSGFGRSSAGVPTKPSRTGKASFSWVLAYVSIVCSYHFHSPVTEGTASLCGPSSRHRAPGPAILCQVAYGRRLPQVTIATRYRRPHIGAPSPSQFNTHVSAGRPRLVTHGQTLTASQWCHVFPKHGTALLRLRIQKTLKVSQPYPCPLKSV